MSNFHETNAAAQVVGLRKCADAESLAAEINKLGKMSYTDLRFASPLAVSLG